MKKDKRNERELFHARKFQKKLFCCERFLGDWWYLLTAIYWSYDHCTWRWWDRMLTGWLQGIEMLFKWYWSTQWLSASALSSPSRLSDKNYKLIHKQNVWCSQITDNRRTRNESVFIFLSLKNYIPNQTPSKAAKTNVVLEPKNLPSVMQEASQSSFPVIHKVGNVTFLYCLNLKNMTDRELHHIN